MNKPLHLLHYVFSSILSIFFQRVNKSIGLILGLLLLSLSSIAQTGATHLYTDYGGYWSSGVGAINPVLPDNDHNLLAFRYNGVVYSTGVNNGILGANGISYTNTKYQAFPVKDIPLSNGSSVFAAYGSLRDNLPGVVGLPAPFNTPPNLQISAVLADGINGLNIGTGVTNIPSTADALTFSFGAITDPSQIGDGKPDIIVSQIADAGNGDKSDQLYFEDANGVRVGNIVDIKMPTVPVLGNWTIDFYNPDGTRGLAPPQSRSIRLWAADAADFGITQANFSNALVLRYKLNGSSDPSFLAFNTAFIQIVSVNDDVASTNENTPVNINVLANDEPKNGLNVNSMSITQQPANGTVSVNTVNGVRLVTYTPNPGFTGVDTFKYQVCNGATTPQCDDAIVTVNVGSADVQVTKTANTLTPSIGGNVVFTLTAKNNGPNTANNVVVRDVLPAGYAFVSTNPATGGFNSATTNWAVGTMANGATASITITARVNASGTYANTATITTTTLDPNENNNASTITPVPGLSTDLEVTKAVIPNNPTVGSNVVFTLTARNIGPSNATGVAVNDLLPNGYTFVSAVPAATTTYNAASGVWNIGSLTSGAASITLAITAKVNATGNYANIATISGAQPDPVVGNNTATSTPVPIAQADLAITKSVLPANPDVNQNVVFTIGLTNNGPSAAAGVIVTDVLPSGYTFVSSSATAGTYTNADGKWILGTVNNAANATLTITAKVNATGTYTNTATASTTTADPTPINSATATPVPVPITDLKVTKTAAKDIINNAASVNPGDTETFTITVTNTGPSAATNVVATDIIPNGYTFSNSTPSVGVYNQTTGKWTIGNLANGASATLTINAVINASGNYSNYVSLTGTEKDLDLSNNEAYAPLVNTNADVSIVKTVNNATPNVGANVIFTLTANNSANSTSDATQVTVTDILPSGYTYVSSSATVGTYNIANGVWYIGNLLKGNTQVLTLVAKVNPSGDYLNTTHVVATQSDPVPANNASQALVTPIANADLSVIKTMNNAELNNNKGVFTIVVTNNGPSTAINVIVNDALPSGYAFNSFSATTGSYAAGVWTVGNLTSGASATLTINSTLNSSGNYVNTATASSATNDLVLANNSSSAQPAPFAPTGNAAQSFCEIADARVSNLVATGNNIKWYAAASGGTVLPGTTALTNGAKYYASQTIAGTESVNRFEVTVSITLTPAPTTTAATQSFCEIVAPTINNLQITGTSVKWYAAASGGTVLPSTTVLVNGAKYYASQTLNGCESKTRREITAVITTTAPPTGAANQSFCEISSPTISELVATATGLVKWYETPTSTVVLSATRPLINGETYYATQTLSGCESLTRFAVTVQISVVPAPTAATPQNFCTSENATVANLLASGSNIQWYANATGGSPLAAATALVNGTTYYASQTVNGCESKNRTPVNVTINVNPTATVSGGGTVCDGATLPNVSIALTGTAPWNIVYNNGTSNIAVTGITTNPYIITNAPAGTYTVTSISNASCVGTSSGSAQVIVNPLPTATVSGGGATCVGSPKSNVSFAFTGTAPFTFTYTDGTNLHTITNTSTNPYILTNAAVGNYSVTAVTDASGCNGTFSGSAQVIENPVPTATISGGGVVCFGVTPPDVVVTLTGTAPFSFNYTIGGVTNSVTNYNSNTFNIVNPAEGTYSVTQLHDANCTGAAASTIVSVIIINVPDVIITHPNCVSNSSGSIRVTSPLDPTIEYSIDNGGTWQSNPLFGGLAAGNFTVLARKGACLSNPRQAVLDPAVNDPVISLIQPNCSLATGTITVTSHPGQEYSLNNGAWVTTNVFAGLTAGNYTVKVRNASTFCESNVANATINAQPPTPNAPTSTSPISYCVGETASILSATADGTNTLLWYNDATGGVGNTTAPTPSTATAGLQEFYVSQRTAAGCESARTKIEININALPPASTTDGDKETCEASVMPTLTATAPAVAGFNVVWYDAASGGNVVTNPTLNTVGTKTYYAALQNATTNCLSSTRTAVVLTINPTSVAPTSGGDQIACATSPIQTLTATATVVNGYSIIWYDAPTGGNITAPTHNAIGTVTYYAASKNDVTNCESLTRTAVVLTINETPSAPIAQDKTECANTPLQTLTATATVQAGQSVIWYDAATAGNIVTNATLATSGTVTYYAATKVDATGCESLTRTPVVLTLRSPLSAGIIGSNQDFCRTGLGAVQPTAITFTTLPSGGATTYTYVWQSSLDNFSTVFGNNLATTANYIPTPINVTTYYRVLITSGDCGTVTSNIITVSVKDEPTLTLVSNANQSLCNTTSIVNIVYTWGGGATGATATNLPNGLIATQDNIAKTITISGTPTVTSTYTITTTGTIAPCTTHATRTGTVTVNPLPAAPTNTTANAVQCGTSPTQSITATADAPGGSSVVWYDASIGGNVVTPTLITVGSKTYYAASKNNVTGCESASRTPVTLTINELPSVPSSGGNQTQCANAIIQTLTATAFAPAGTTTVWYNAASGGNIVNNPTLNKVGTITYYAASQDNLTGCFSLLRTPVTLTINPRSTAAHITVAPKAICAGNKTILEASTSLASPVFRWYATADLSGAPLFTGDDFTTPILTATTTYYVTVQGDDVCENLPNTALAVTVTVNTLPTATIGGTVSVCQGATDPVITFTGANGTAPYTFTYNIDGGANQTVVSTGNVATLNQSSATAGTFIYNLVSVEDASITKCSSIQSGSATITVNPTPKGFNDVVGLDCSGNFTYNLQANVDNTTSGGNALASAFTWTVSSNANITGSSNGNGTSINQTLINTSNTVQQLVYTITPTAAGVGNCAGNNFAITVNVPVCSSMTISKAADKTSITKAGDVINYTITVKNTGNANQTNVIVNDPLISSSALASPNGDNGNGILEKGETWTYAGSYTVLQSDIDNDGNPNANSHIIRNTATVTSTEISSAQSSTADVNITSSPAITLVKTGVLALDGNTVTYTFTVKNTGNVTINNLSISDVKILTPIVLSSTTLAPNASTTATATYTILQSEKETGSVTNTATVSGKTSSNTNVSDISGSTETDANPTIVNTGVLAVNDSGSANGFTGGEAVANVLANDTYNGNPATLANVNLSKVSTTNANVTLDPLTGKVNVAPNTPAGTYTVEYRIEDKLNPGQFKTASITVTVDAPVMVANTDTGSANGFTGGEAVANVLANDTYNGNPATLANVNLSQVSTTNANVTLDPLTGKVNVAPNTPFGTYTVEYRIEDKLNPGQFKTANVTVTVDVPVMVANADTGNANGFTGGEAVENVLANDTYNGNPATLLNVNLTQVSTTNANVTLDPLTGKVNVAANTPAGTYTVEYRIEDKLNPGQFKSASVMVTVDSPAMIAVADTGSANGFTGGEAVANVLANDTYNGNPATLANVNLSQVSTTNANVTLDPLMGKVNVAPNTPAGTYTVEYQIEDKLNPGQFKTASVTVTVDAPVMVANTDTGSANGFTGGEAVANVLTNDSYNGNPATLANVNLSQVSTTNANVTLDPLTGKVNVAPNTPAGTYTVEYRIEDKLNPGQFKTASVTVTVDAPAMIAVADAGSANGFTGGEAVANVLANDTYNGNPATLTNVNLSQVSTTNANVTLDPLTGKVNVAPNTPGGTYTVEYRIEDKLNPGQFKTASVTVTVDAPAMIALADTGLANGFTGGEAVANVLANDTYNGNPATLANVNLSQVSTTNANVTLDPLTGKVNVAPNTPAGTYTVEYRIEDKLNPGQFKTASVTVTVTTGTIAAVADNGSANGFDGGVAIANILANDTYNGNTPASLSNVNISQLSTSNTNINIDVNTGTVNIAAGTQPGTYTLTYEIVDKLDITKKSIATITVVVSEWVTDLSIIKTANKTGVELNENISYTITVKNNGPATVLAGKVIGLIENVPAGLDNVTYTANGGTYNVTNQTFTIAANLLAGQTVSLVVDGKINAAYTQNSISNNATVNAATGTNDPDAANNAATITTPILKGKVTLVKAGAISANGNTITYNFTISNIGDVALNNITLVDAKLGLNKTLPGTLAIGESMNHTEIYTLTQADKDLGSVTNTASVKSKSPAGNDITDVSGTDASNDNATVVTVNAPSGLELTKVANNTVGKVGDVINYTLVVKNTGTVTLSNVVVTDAKADAGSILPASIVTLLPGASVSLTAKHTLTQTEVDNGSFSNQASVSGKNPQNVTVSDLLSDNPNTPAVDDATITPIIASPSVLFTKTALNSVSKVGDVINYTLIVRNTGNVTLTNLVVTDAGADAGSISPSTIASLAPGEMVTIAAKHTLTQSEVNAGRFSNQANVVAKDPKGNVINKVSDDPNTVTADDATVVNIGSAAAMVLTKTANNTGVKAGDVLNYTLIVKNTGNVTLTNVVVVDAGADAGSILPATIPSILPGATAVVTAKHTLTQAEINTGSFSNQASASGKDPLNNTVADPKSDDPNTPAVDDPTVVILTPNANIVTVKELKNQNQISYIPGDDVIYKITITNNGPSAATNVRVVDNAPVGTSIVKWTATASGLTLPNATGTGNLDQTIPLMPNAGVVVYEVTVKTVATSNLQLSNTVVVTSSTPDLTTAGDILTTATIPAEIRNDLSITKTSNHNLASGVNDEFDYVITVKNNGLFTANSVVVTDVLSNGITYISHNSSSGNAVHTISDNTLIWTTPTLSAGATITLTLKVKATISGLISNTATVKAAETDPSVDNNTATDLKEIFRLNTKPNVITPNGDGKNDTYIIDGLELYPENYLRIFNRWGNEVFHSNGSYKNDWNGNGLKEGTYYYLLKVKEPNGTMSFSKGFITLLRNN